MFCQHEGMVYIPAKNALLGGEGWLGGIFRTGKEDVFQGEILSWRNGIVISSGKDFHDGKVW